MTDAPSKTEPPDLTDFSELLEQLFDDARGEILGTLFYLVGNIEDARDALQETFLKCWRKRQELSDITNLRAWVFRVALNTGRDFRKTAWNRRRQSLAEDAVMVSTAESPDSGLVQDEQIQRLQHAVRQLRAEEQEVFLLRQNGELTYEEIAQTTSLPIGTVKTRMRTAIRQLRQSVGDLS
ncbi:RNA polymerase sigma factor [Stieleria varia]|nr:sigma-70 family RNA polymerase sigma factor [Stieleria varia]